MVPILINKFVLIPGLVLASGGALFAGSALSVTDTTDAIASVVAVLEISAPGTVDFGAITPLTSDTASDFNVTVISNGTADPGRGPLSSHDPIAPSTDTGYELFGSWVPDDVALIPDIELQQGTDGAPGGTTFFDGSAESPPEPNFDTDFGLLTEATVMFASRASGITPAEVFAVIEVIGVEDDPLTEGIDEFVEAVAGVVGVLPGDKFPVSLRLPTVEWQAAANSGTIGVVTFTVIAA